jgi:hypothetical protein
VTSLPGPGGPSNPGGVEPDRFPDQRAPAGTDRRPRPMIERIGMTLIALVLAGMFAVVAVAAFTGGELFLATMGVVGCLMVLWVGGLTLLRG